MLSLNKSKKRSHSCCHGYPILRIDLLVADIVAKELCVDILVAKGRRCNDFHSFAAENNAVGMVWQLKFVDVAENNEARLPFF